MPLTCHAVPALFLPPASHVAAVLTCVAALRFPPPCTGHQRAQGDQSGRQRMLDFMYACFWCTCPAAMHWQRSTCSMHGCFAHGILPPCSATRVAPALSCHACLGPALSSPGMEGAAHAQRGAHKRISTLTACVWAWRGVALCRSWRPRCASWSSWCGSRTQRSRRSWPSSPARGSRSAGGRAPASCGAMRRRSTSTTARVQERARQGAVSRCLPGGACAGREFAGSQP